MSNLSCKFPFANSMLPLEQVFPEDNDLFRFHNNSFLVAGAGFEPATKSV